MVELVRGSSVCRCIASTFAIAAISYGLTACNGGVSRAPIIDEYRVAKCVPASIESGTREWNATLTLFNGSHVTVSAGQRPSWVSVHYVESGFDGIAADPGDYVYPGDIRLDPRREILYTKAYGLAAGIWQET